MKYNLIVFFTSLITFLFCSCDSTGDQFKISSPNESLQIEVTDNDGKIEYSLLIKGDTLISSSEITIYPDAQAEITSSKKSTEDNSWEPTWGQFSKIRDYYNGLELDINFNDVNAKLYVRAYDQGVGLRYDVESYNSKLPASFDFQYKLAEGQFLYSPNREREPLGPLSIQDLSSLDDKQKLRTPLIVEQADKPYLSILESDLFTAEGFESMKVAFDKESRSITSTSEVNLEGGKLISPWRVILINDVLGDLVTNTVTMNLAAPLAIDASWVKPGKTLWDWRVHGYTAPDGFTYGINTESYKRFIDFQIEMGIEYFLIDDYWFKSASPGKFEMSDDLDLQEVIDYANQKGANLLLYYDNRHGSYGDDALFPYYESLGMKGMKYGFMGDDAVFTRQAVKKSAASHLIIDFHDGPVPITGIERTYPNAVTKEFCHAQQDSRRAFTPEAFIKMALINAIQGPLDMNNGNFGLIGINNGEREKGPKQLNSYPSTVVSEAARTLIIHSGLVCIPDAPEEYRTKKDLFEFIQKQPVGKWDESKVLNAKMGKYITTARSYQDQWFIGSVYDQRGGTLDIALDFLDEGKEYKVTYYEDTDETHCITNPEAYKVRSGTVKKGDIVKAKIAPGGGHCMWIRME